MRHVLIRKISSLTIIHITGLPKTTLQWYVSLFTTTSRKSVFEKTIKTPRQRVIEYPEVSGDDKDILKKLMIV